MPSIYDEREEGRVERELDEALSDGEGDELLEGLEARYARFRQEVFPRWSPARQAAFDRRCLLFSCLQARDTIAHFSGETLELEEDVDRKAIADYFRTILKSAQSSLARLRVWRAASLASASVQ